MSGGITRFAQLSNHVGVHSVVDGANSGKPAPPPAHSLRSVSLEQLALNPFNPRDSLGDVDGLASIADNQLTPLVVVTVGKFKEIYPETDVTGRYVVINGNRRLAAAHKFGRPKLDVVVRDDLAEDRASLLTAAVLENLAREGFDLIEEAKAIDQLVREYGNTGSVARHLGKSDGYVSQRRSLLKLVPELQEALRRGTLPLREARELAQLSPAEQLRRWGLMATATGTTGAVVVESEPVATSKQGSGAQASRARSLSRSLKRFDTDPAALVTMLSEELGEARLKTLVGRLKKLI
jgi:ParB family chromosome partitioning protein